MDVKVCINCKKLFNYICGEVLCPACRKQMDEKFSNVKEYLYNNKGSSIYQVSMACDVNDRTIKRWLQEGRLELDKNSPININCEICGQKIQTGKYCNQCIVQTQIEFNSALTQKKVSIKENNNTNPRMRHLNSRN